MQNDLKYCSGSLKWFLLLGGLQGYIIYGSGGLQGFLLLSWFTQISIEISIAKVVLHCFLLLRWFYTDFYCSGGLKWLYCLVAYKDI